MNNNKQITFRRIGGRIVPINVNKANKDKLLKGAAATAVGVGASVAAGKVYRKVVSKSLFGASKSWKALDRVDVLSKKPLRSQTLFASTARQKGIGKLLAKGEGYAAVGSKFSKFAAPARIGSLLVGAALLGYGASKINEAFNRRKVDSKVVGSAVATGAFITGAYGGAGARTALKSTYMKAYPFIRAFKGKLKL